MSDDDPLIRRVQAGDPQALGEFIDRFRRQLLVYIERNLSDTLRRKVEPVDILQEVSLSAVASLSEVPLDARDPFGWLCQLAERRIIDAHRRLFGAQKRSASREVGLDAPVGGDGERGFVDLLVASMTSPSQAFSRGQREFALNEALAALPEESREALRLRYVEGLPSKEIAEKLGKTDGATRVLLSRAVAKLQTLLSGNDLFRSFLGRPGSDADKD